MIHRGIRTLEGRKGALLALRVKPRARKNEIAGIMSDGTVQVHISAPPVEGKANTALLKFLAEILDVPVAHLDILSGSGGRNKLVSVQDMDPEVLHKKIGELAGENS
jgi:uncharacterized protein (TIGR00251 family)